MSSSNSHLCDSGGFLAKMLEIIDKIFIEVDINGSEYNYCWDITQKGCIDAVPPHLF